METIQSYGDNRFEKHTKMRQACRGIVMKEGNILLTYEVNTDQWFIPGGGLEGTESKEDCCMRELAEETGFLVEHLRDFLTIMTWYPRPVLFRQARLCHPVSEQKPQAYFPAAVV